MEVEEKPMFAENFCMEVEEISDDSKVKEIIIEYECKLKSNMKTKSLTPHSINLEKEFPIINIRNYKNNYYDQDVIIQEVNDLLNKGKIQESQSPWNSPLLPVPKKDGTKRMCIDFRKLNERSIVESYPPPLIEDCLNILGDQEYFTTLDLDSGYHQIPLATESCKFTAFTTPLGKFEYTHLPFGLRKAPAHFQNLMYLVLKENIIRKEAVVYMDDIVLFSKDINSHYRILRNILFRLAEFGLVINYKKCNFLKLK